METDKVVKAMARWWQTVSNEDNDPNARNPMLYDPLQDGTVKTTKTMQYVATIVICLGAVSAGTALAWTSPVLPQLTPPEIENETISMIFTNITVVSSNVTSPVITETNQTAILNPINGENVTNSTEDKFYLTLDERSWVSSLLGIGACIGAIPSGYISDKIGRKYTAIIMDIPFIISWICIIYSNTPGLLYFGRFLIGIATGSYCVIAPMYISEIAETSIRGLLGTFFQLFLTIGILFVYFIGALINWKLLSIFCLFIPIILFVLMFFIPETPTYLLKKGRRGDAALSIKWLWGRYCDSRTALQLIQKDLDSTDGETSFLDLFKNRANLKGLFIALALMFFQQFSGINAVIFFTVPIFKSSGSDLNPSLCTIIVGIVQVLMTFISSLLIERAGRKILLIFSSTIMAICLAILGAFFNMKYHGHDVTYIGWLPLLCVVMFIVTFSIGYGPIPWLIIGELFLPNVKGIAASIIVMFNWITVFIVTKSFNLMYNQWGSDYTFWFFSIFMIIGSLFVSFFVFETKGKSTTQIQMQLSGEKVN